jgi:hypothetical protein
MQSLCPFRALVIELNRLTPNKRWTRRTVANVLMNDFYTGVVQYHDERYPGQHEAIVPQWLFDKVQKVRISRAKHKSKPHTKRIHLLTGILTCSSCGEAMYGSTNRNWARGEPETKRKFYYLDSARTRGIPCPHAGRHIPAHILDTQAIEIVKQLRLPEDWQDQIVEIANYPAEREKIKRRARKLKGRLKRLGDRYELGDLEREEYIRRRNELAAELATLDVPETPAVIQAGEYLVSLAGLWDSLTKKEKREVLHIIFADILVDVGKQKIIAVKPNPDFVRLFRFDGLKEEDNGYFYISRNSETS